MVQRAEQSAGVRNKNSFLVAMENWDRIKQMSQEAMQAEGFSDSVQEKWADSLNGKLKTLSATVDEFWSSFLKSDALGDGINLLQKAMDAIVAINKPLLSLTVGITGLFTLIGSIKSGFLRNAILSVTGFGDAFSGLAMGITSAFSALKAGKGFSSAFGELKAGASTALSAINPVTVAIMALVASYAILSKATTDYREAIEQASTAHSNYESTKSEVESLNGELNTTQDRMDELKSKGTLTLTEQQELINLQEQNDQLKKQIELKEQLADIQLEKSANASQQAWDTNSVEQLLSGTKYDNNMTAWLSARADDIGLSDNESMLNTWSKLSAFGMSSGTSGIWNMLSDLISGNQITLDSILGEGISEQYNNVLDMADVDDSKLGMMKSKIQTIEDLKKQLDQAYKNGDTQQYDTISKKITESQSALNDYYVQLQSISEGFYNDDNSVINGMEKYAQEWEKIDEMYQRSVLGNKGYEAKQLSDLFSEEDYSSISERLQNLAKNSSNIEEFKQAFQGSSGVMKQFATDCNEAGISAETLYNEMEALNGVDKAQDLKQSLFGKNYATATDDIKDTISYYKNEIKEAQDLGVDTTQTIFGNVDTNNRQRLEWTTDNLHKYKEALMSWNKDVSWDNIVDEYKNSYSTVDGMSTEFDGVEIAFTPMLQTEQGAELLDSNTVYSYINGLINKAGDGWNNEELLKLDADGIEIDGRKIKGLIAGIGDEAEKVGQSMHFTGKDGSIADAYNEIEQIAKKSNMTVEQYMNAINISDWIDSLSSEDLEILATVKVDKNASLQEIQSVFKDTKLNNYLISDATLANIQTSADNATSGYDSLITAMSEYNETGKLTEDTTIALTSSYGDITPLLEKTGTGYRVNAEKAKEYADASAQASLAQVEVQKALAQTQYDKASADLEQYTSKYSGLQSALESNDLTTYFEKLKATGTDISEIDMSNIENAFNNQQGLENTISKLNEVESGLLNATSAYQGWIDAQSMADTGTQYDESINALSEIRKTLKATKSEEDEDGNITYTYDDAYGKTNSLTYKAAVEWLVPSEIDGTNKQEVTGWLDSLANYIDSDTGRLKDQGAKMMSSMQSAGLEKTENGWQLAGNKSMEEFANGLMDGKGVSLEYLSSIMGELEEYGTNFSNEFKDTLSSSITDKLVSDMANFSENASDAQQKMQNFKNTIQTMDELGMNTSSLKETYNELAEMQGMEKINIEVNASGNAITSFDSIKEKVDSLKETVNVTAEGKIDFNHADTEVKNYIQYLQNLNPEIKAELGIDKSTNDQIFQEILNGTLTAEILGEFGNIDTSVLDNIQPEVQIYANLTNAEQAIDDFINQPFFVDENQIRFQGNVQGVEQAVTAVKNEDGTVTYSADIDGVKTTLKREVSEEDGTVIYSPNTDKVDTALEQRKEVNGTMTFKAEASDVQNKLTLIEKTALIEKIIPLKAIDQATPYIYLWNTLSADPKFTTLSAQDQASIVVETYNALSVEDKKSILEATDNASDKVESFNGLAFNDKNSNLSATDNATSIINSINNTVLQDKSCTLTTRIRTVYETVKSALGFASGTAYANGVADIKGNIPYNVFSNKKYRTTQDQMALTGELGTELWVDPKTNSWRLLGQNGAEFSSIPANSIVFNHKQTNELLSKGFTNGRGKAYASGSNVVEIGSGSTGKKADISEVWDRIAIMLQRLDRTLDNLKSSVDKYSYRLTKQNQVTQQAIDQTRTNIDKYQQASVVYSRLADSVGLSSSYKSQIKNGSLKASEITNSNLKEKIDKYTDYYNSYLDAKDKIQELQQSLVDLAQTKLNNIEQYYQNRYDYNQDYGIATNITQIKTALSAYKKELESQVKSGIIKKYSNEWYEATGKIASYLKTIFEETLNKIQYKLNSLTRSNQTMNNVLDLKEAQGQTITDSDYQSIISNNNKQVTNLWSQRKAYLEEMSNYAIASEKYQELADKVSDCDDKIYSLWMSNEDLKDSIRELRWESFNNGIDTIENTVDEIEWLKSNLNDLVDDDGNLTADGLANISLIAQGMAQQKQIIADYREALKKLNEERANGNITEQEYIESSREYQSVIRDSSDAVEDYKDELIDLYTSQMKTENDALQDLIDKRKEALDAKKSYYEYDRTIKKQSKDVNAIKAQISALQGTNSESAKAELAKLKAELAEKEDDLSDTKYEHAIQMRTDGYNTLANNAQEALDKTLKELSSSAQAQNAVIDKMLNSMVNSYSTSFNRIAEIITSTGVVLSDATQQVINTANSVTGSNNLSNSATSNATDYTPSDSTSSIDTSGISTTSGTTSNTQDTIKDTISGGIDETSPRVIKTLTLSGSSSMYYGETQVLSPKYYPSDATNKKLTWKSSSTCCTVDGNGKVTAIYKGTATITATAQDGGGAKATFSVTSKAGVRDGLNVGIISAESDKKATVGEKVTYASGSYYATSAGGGATGTKNKGKSVYIQKISSGAKYPYHIGTSSTFGTGTLGWVKLSQLTGYANGTRNATDGWHEIDEQGTELAMRYVNYNGKNYTRLTAGSEVMKADMSDTIFAFAKNPSDFLSENMPNTGAIVTNNNGMSINISYDNMINIEGNADDGTAKAINNAIPDITKQITNQLKNEMKKLGWR